MNLHVVQIPKCITSFKDLATLTNLRELRLFREFQDSDESTRLAGLPYLTQLHSGYREWHNTRFISLLTQLKTACVACDWLQSLSGLTNLTDLNLLSSYPSRARSSDSSVVLALTNVTRLALSDPDLIPTVGELTQLKYLHIACSDRRNSSSEVLSNLTNLETFLSPSIFSYDLSPFTKLTRLRIDAESIPRRPSSGFFLACLTNRTSLELWSNSVLQNSVIPFSLSLSYLQDLVNLTNLVDLKLVWENCLSDSVFFYTSQLRSLSLSHCAKMKDWGVVYLQHITRLVVGRVKFTFSRTNPTNVEIPVSSQGRRSI